MAYPTEVMFPEDLTGTAATNAVADEIHIKERLDDTILVLNHGPFYAESLAVYDKVTGGILKEGKDYDVGCYFAKASLEAGKPVYSVIILKDREIGSGIRVSYQAIGGQYSADIESIYTVLKELLAKNQKILWDDIIKPDSFKPTEHLHHSDDIYGMEPVVNALIDIADQLRYYNNTLVDKVVEEVIANLMAGFLTRIPIDNVEGLRDVLEHFAATHHEINLRLVAIETSIKLLQEKDVELRKLIDANKSLITTLRQDLTDLTERVTENERQLVVHDSRMDGIDGRINGINSILTQHDNRLNSLRADLTLRHQEIQKNTLDISTLSSTFNMFKSSTSQTLILHQENITKNATDIADIRRIMNGYIFYNLEVDTNQSGVLKPNSLWLADSSTKRNRALPTVGIRDGDAIYVKDKTNNAENAHIEISGAIESADRGISIDTNNGFVLLVYSFNNKRWSVAGGQ